MMPEQLPDITQDKGIQDETREIVKAMLRRRKVDLSNLTEEIEAIAYAAMLRGQQSGFSYGWKIGQQRLLEQQKRDRVFAKQMGL
jgi:hypothetical protein